MIRTFAEHRVRQVVSLDGGWELVTREDAKLDHRGLPRSYNRRLITPAPWESIPALINYRGVGFLRRFIDVPAGRPARLVFAGVSHTADVYVDGRSVAHHEDAFTPFDALIAPSKADASRELVVRADNTFGDHAALHIPNDYYTYGGITRPVELQIVDEVHLAWMHATPRRDGRRWALDVTLGLRNVGRAPVKRNLELRIAGDAYDGGRVTVNPGQTRAVALTIEALDVEPWSADAPKLYDLTAELLDEHGKATDDLIDRVGFRTIEVRGKKLLLNGVSLRLRGFNRHEDLPPYGCAVPLAAMAHDLRLMADLGANFVRTSHYPNDQRFLDLCDELGFYVWEESHARTVSFAHPRYREQIDASTREMVRWHFNHPCILMWGCLNECETRTADGAAEHGRVLKLLRSLDGSRPVTYASMYHKKDKAYRFADIVSWNRYDGWYGEKTGNVAADTADLLKWLHSSASTGGRNKPVIFSEFGAGAIPGYRDARRVRWSEEYQCAVLDETLRTYLHHPDIVGAAIWQFCDVRVTEEAAAHHGGAWWTKRPRTMNNKGVVDEHRRPKLAYDLVKRHFHEAAQEHDR
jgi:beta-glucuronidase